MRGRGGRMFRPRGPVFRPGAPRLFRGPRLFRWRLAYLGCWIYPVLGLLGLLAMLLLLRGGW